MTKLCMVRRYQSDQNRRITRVKSSTRQKLHYLCKDEDLFDVNNIKKKCILQACQYVVIGTVLQVHVNWGQYS